MKVEYLHNGATACPLIRIMYFTRDELRELRRAFVRLARGSEKSVSIRTIDHVECVHGIDLLLQSSDKDEGILLRHATGTTFHCRLSRDGWLEANAKAKAIEKVIDPGYSNDLNCDGDVMLLLSYDGKW